MSETASRLSLDDLGNPICEFCGCEIEEPDCDCPALEDGCARRDVPVCPPVVQFDERDREYCGRCGAMLVSGGRR